MDLLKFEGEGNKLFTQKEVSAISELGRMEVILELHDIHKLEDSLIELFLNKFTAKSKYEALTSNQQRVQKMIGNTL